ncbi:MAG: SDR family NAD(P)-dependent oxidoreductase [Aeromicrobium sp.]
MADSPDRTVLITGCSSGIGEATATRLVRSGWQVHATARRPETLDALATEGCHVHALDVTDEGSMHSAVESMLGQTGGTIDALVNNAGYSQSGATETLAIDDVRRQFETNVFGLLRLSQLVLPAMRSQRSGRIVNIGSMGGRLTFPGGGAYHATKYAVEALSDAMRMEVGGFGVRVVLVEPGLITTGFDDAAVASMAGNDDGVYADFNTHVAASTREAYAGPMRHLGGGPDRVAKVVQRALETQRPKARYPVTPSARLAMGARRLMGDRAWDAAMRSQFPPPR